ncbi:MAG TPA: DUF2064 domain-containing protein [Pseudolysinimonas sp.]|jgi:hypothetical protein
MTTLVIIAKECLPGRVKTRLHPALSFEQAAEAAAASLADTFAALSELPADRRILAFDGTVPPLGSEPYDVIPQATGDLDERLAAVFDAAEGPTLLVGMDTPQLRAEHLARFFPWAGGDDSDQADFVFGPALDGGFWCLGMREPRGDLIRGVPMSRDDTGVQQLQRLCATGGDIRMLPPLLDVDTIVEAHAVAALAPETRFAQVLRSMVGVAA